MRERLRILQYNVHHSRKVMDPLLASREVEDIDVIAIQEPYLCTNEIASVCVQLEAPFIRYSMAPAGEPA